MVEESMRRLIPLTVGCIALLFLAAKAVPETTAAPSMALRSIQSGGLTRYYRVHEPVGYDPQIATPLVMAFHGGGGNAVQFANQIEMYQTANANNFLLVFPEGTGLLGGPPLFTLETWNAGNCCGWAQQHGVDDVQFVRDMVAALSAEWNVDLNHVYATGHSNGAMMSYRLGVEAADLVTAIAPNAGSLGVAPPVPTAIPLMVMHGKLDTNVPFAGGVGSGISGTDFRSQRESVLPFARANGVTSYSLQETRGQALRYEGVGSSGSPIHYWYLQDGGHSWPGHGSVLGDPVNMDIDANDEVWAFFSQF
jgi:polyhydroxybutyrate depolymerase